MKILNFGSLNIDYVYAVDHFVRPGETLSSRSFQKFFGGKGLNQSVALARAGSSVFHAGKIGSDGLPLKDFLADAGVNVSCIQFTQETTGHAVIQVNPEGENCIILHGGANQQITRSDVDTVLNQFAAGDLLLLQNGISEIPYIIEKAAQRSLKIVFNPAPMQEGVKNYPLHHVDWLIVNRGEARGLSGVKSQDEIIQKLTKKYPRCRFLMTLGGEGAVSFGGEHSSIFVPAERVRALDTTAAGDTFIGYFLACQAEGKSVEESLKVATRASALCVTRLGAATSIPKRQEL